MLLSFKILIWRSDFSASHLRKSLPLEFCSAFFFASTAPISRNSHSTDLSSYRLRNSLAKFLTEFRTTERNFAFTNSTTSFTNSFKRTKTTSRGYILQKFVACVPVIEPQAMKFINNKKSTESGKHRIHLSRSYYSCFTGSFCLALKIRTQTRKLTEIHITKKIHKDRQICIDRLTFQY